MSNSEIARNLFLIAAPERTHPETRSIEAELIDRVRSGDRDVFDEIYRMFAPLVHGVVLARVPHAEVQDIVQDVFLTAYKQLHTLRDAHAVGAWVATIARNRAAEFYRQARPTEELTEEFESRNHRHAEAREILSAIRALPEAYRETLVLRLVEGMTGSEIAERTGIKPESVRVNLHRGMQMLRQRLGIGGKK
jgi:RNA polymerase sigma-70 factor (ECF subfamily)